MLHNDLIGGMPLPDQGSDNSINAMELLLGKIDPGARISEYFTVSAVRKECIIVILMEGDRTMGMSFITAVTDIGSPVNPDASFPHTILTMLVA